MADKESPSWGSVIGSILAPVILYGGIAMGLAGAIGIAVRIFRWTSGL